MFKPLYCYTLAVNLKVCGIHIDVKYVLIPPILKNTPIIISLTHYLFLTHTQSTQLNTTRICDIIFISNL